MSFHSHLTWTSHGLTRAFLQFALAYSLLFISVSLYIPSKFLKLFGLYFPCPCSGVFRYSNRNLCIDNLFVKLPKQMISSIFNSLWRKFPFELISSEDQRCSSDEILIRDRNYETGVLQLETNNFSAPSFQNMICKAGHEAKRRRITRQRTRITSSSAVAKIAARESGSSVLKDYSIKEDLKEEIYSNGEIREGEKEVGEKEANLVETLERALEEEEAAFAALYTELEKERAASATAAEEAMAMICRLQHDKAMIEMEAKQYRRLMDEKLAHDEEEFSIVEEILIRREMDTRFLEKEIEAYMEMGRWSDLKRKDYEKEHFSGGMPDHPSKSRKKRFDSEWKMAKPRPPISTAILMISTLLTTLINYNNAERDQSSAEIILNNDNYLNDEDESGKSPSINYMLQQSTNKFSAVAN